MMVFFSFHFKGKDVSRRFWSEKNGRIVISIPQDTKFHLPNTGQHSFQWRFFYHHSRREKKNETNLNILVYVHIAHVSEKSK